MPTWSARLTSNGRLTIPIGARRHLGIEPGDIVVWEKKDGKIYLRKKSEENSFPVKPEDDTESGILVRKDEGNDPS